MKSELRREAIYEELQKAKRPVSASALAARFEVSRQIIVGDVALLRSSGKEITATPKGYVIDDDTSDVVRRVAVCHSAAETEKELNIMVDNGCIVLDVIVEHALYGQITGTLQLSNRYDVKQFLKKSDGVTPLSALTEGIHLHTISCPDEEAYERVLSELREEGLLVEQ